MPRYFFDLDSNQDHVGAEFADDEAAWREALRTMREFEDALVPGDTWRLTVRRENRILYRIEVKTTGWQGPGGPTAPLRGH